MCFSQLTQSCWHQEANDYSSELDWQVLVSLRLLDPYSHILLILGESFKSTRWSGALTKVSLQKSSLAHVRLDH